MGTVPLLGGVCCAVQIIDSVAKGDTLCRLMSSLVKGLRVFCGGCLTNLRWSFGVNLSALISLRMALIQFGFCIDISTSSVMERPPNRSPSAGRFSSDLLVWSGDWLGGMAASGAPGTALEECLGRHPLLSNLLQGEGEGEGHE